MNPRHVFLLAAALLATPLAATAQQRNPTRRAAAAAQQAADPYRWLETVESPRALAWVAQQDTATMHVLGRDSLYPGMYRRALAVMSSRDRIAYPQMMGDALYNYWQDPTHPRGIWRRTSWASYLSGSPQWTTVLDVDSLSKAEGVDWAWKGATCLAPADTDCLVRLSRGGADAVEVREFDTTTGAFVNGGFHLPESKLSVAWLDADHLLVATDFGPGSMTTSGYARIAKLWTRGTPLTAARTLLEGENADVSVRVGAFRTGGHTWGVVVRSPHFFERMTWVLQGDSLVKVDLPLDADMDVVGDRLVVYLRSPWNVGGKALEAGTLVSTSLDGFLAGGRDFSLVLKPGPRATIEGSRTTEHYLLVSMLDEVRPKLLRYQYDDGAWKADTIPVPDFGSAGVVAASSESDRFFFNFSSFTQPSTLYLADTDGSVREVKRLPAQFDADNLVAEQHQATSKDGTKIPYFIVHTKGMKHDGTNPTLQYGYGGFEVSLTPSYNPLIGVNWLARGGVYVLANIRGGGEFGPSWHRAAMKEHRQRAYDDFIAVAEDLIQRKITSPEHLGIMGGSNGGLLMGVMLTERPDLWNGVVILNPLLDMKRYSHLLAGASWMAEYGNPDVPADWAYISKYSPQQNIKRGVKYPTPFIYTDTRDDRVHPGHARKFAAKLEADGHKALFFENTEGGHGGGVTPAQRAEQQALVYTYLWSRLGGP